jgi:hypothetical protein
MIHPVPAASGGGKPKLLDQVKVGSKSPDTRRFSTPVKRLQIIFN